MKSLKPNLLYQLFASFVFAFTPILTFPYISRTLGPENIGKINFIDSTSQLFILIASFGIPLYGSREIAKYRSQQDKKNAIVSELLCIHFAVTLLCIALFFLTLHFNNTIFLRKELLVLGAINIAFNAFALDWFIHGLEDFKFFSIRSVLTKILLVATIFIVVKTRNDYIKYYSILVINSIIIILIDVIYLWFAGTRFRIPDINLKRHLKPLGVFFLTAVSISTYTFLNTFLLGILTNSFAVGFYTTSLKIVKLSQSMVNDLSGVLLPRLSYLVESDNSSEISRLLNISILFVFTVSIPLGIFFFITAPEIIQLTAGKEFFPSIITLQILSAIPLVIGLGRIFGFQILIPFRKEKLMLLPVCCGSIVCIALSVLLCFPLKENGAAIAYLIAEIAVTGIMGYYAKRILPIPFPKKQLLGICISSLIFIPFVALIRMRVESALLIFIYSFLFCVSSFVLLQYFFFKNPVVKTTMAFLFNAIQWQKTKKQSKFYSLL